MSEHGWILLNVHEHDRTNWFDYASVLNMLRYNYSNSTIVVKVIILQFLSAGFVHPGTLLEFYCF